MAQVAPAIMAISAIASAGIAVYSATRSFDAAQDAEKLGRLNAAYTEEETAEEVRRVGKEQERSRSMSKARAAASGLTLSYTLEDVLEEQENIHVEELDWLIKSGKSRAEIAKEGGKIAGDQAMASGYQSLASAFGQSGNIYKAGQTAKWWK